MQGDSTERFINANSKLKSGNVFALTRGDIEHKFLILLPERELSCRR